MRRGEFYLIKKVVLAGHLFHVVEKLLFPSPTSFATRAEKIRCNSATFQTSPLSERSKIFPLPLRWSKGYQHVTGYFHFPTQNELSRPINIFEGLTVRELNLSSTSSASTTEVAHWLSFRPFQQPIRKRINRQQYTYRMRDILPHGFFEEGNHVIWRDVTTSRWLLVPTPI